MRLGLCIIIRSNPGMGVEALLRRSEEKEESG